MKKIGKLILPIIAIALLSCASGHHEPFPEETPIARDLDAFTARLKMLCDGSPLLKLEQAGRIEYKGFSAPIWVVRYRPPGAERRVLITGGVHGNEPAGCAWIVELVGMIAEQPRSYENSGLDLVPLVNPWGWSRDIRYNRDGKDINRDFASFETQEARILRSLFASRDYDLVILRTRDGLIDAPRWGLRYMRLTGQLSITNYLCLEGCREVYTIETPTQLQTEDRLPVHRMAFELIFRGVME